MFEPPCLSVPLWLKGLLFGFKGDNYTIRIHLDQVLSSASAILLTGVFMQQNIFGFRALGPLGLVMISVMISSMLIMHGQKE